MSKQNKAVAHAINALGAKELCAQIGVSKGFLSSMKNGRRAVPIKKAVAIEKACQGLVGRKSLRPNDWYEIWPELAEQEADLV